MAKSSFTKPSAATPKGPAPAPAKGPAKPTPAARPAPAAAKPTPAARPAPAAKPTPAAPAKPAPTARAAPQRPTPRAQPQPEEVPDGAVVVVDDDNMPPAVTQNLMAVPLGQGSGDFTPSDFALPKLKLAQGIGPLAEAGFAPGQLVLNDGLVLWETGCEPVKITILRYTKQFVENIPYGSEEFPRMFDTAEAANAAGLSTEWGPNGEKPEALPQLNAMVLIEQPDGVEADEFPLTLGDRLFAVAMFRISGTSYPIVKTITSAQRTRLKNGLHTGSFHLTSNQVKTPKFTYQVMVLQPGEAHPEEIVDAIVQAAAEM